MAASRDRALEGVTFTLLGLIGFAGYLVGPDWSQAKVVGIILGFGLALAALPWSARVREAISQGRAPAFQPRTLRRRVLELLAALSLLGLSAVVLYALASSVADRAALGLDLGVVVLGLECGVSVAIGLTFLAIRDSEA